jgi:hypothetical protein
MFYLDHVESDGRLVFEEVVKMDLEGIVCKQKHSPYKVTEKPSRYWIKVKNSRYSQLVARTELVERAKASQKCHPETYRLYSSLILLSYSRLRSEFLNRRRSCAFAHYIASCASSTSDTLELRWRHPECLRMVLFGERVSEVVARNPKGKGNEKQREDREASGFGTRSNCRLFFDP